MTGILILVPTPIAPESDDAARVGFDPERIVHVRHFIVEEARTARRFLRKLFPGFPIDSCQFSILNEHTPPGELPSMITPLLEGNDMVLMSEAGLPCVADPGWQVVALAHQASIKVRPLPGPSSLMQALMASGFTGQQFVFHGYLPVIPSQRAKSLLQIEKEATLHPYTHIFIETPYRNQQMLTTLIRILRPDTNLSVALGLMTTDETIISKPIISWKTDTPTLSKVPAVFLLSRTNL